MKRKPTIDELLAFIAEIEKDLLVFGVVTEDELETLWSVCHRVLNTHEEYLNILMDKWMAEVDEETILKDLALD